VSEASVSHSTSTTGGAGSKVNAYTFSLTSIVVDSKPLAFEE